MRLPQGRPHQVRRLLGGAGRVVGAVHPERRGGRAGLAAGGRGRAAAHLPAGRRPAARVRRRAAGDAAAGDPAARHGGRETRLERSGRAAPLDEPGRAQARTLADLLFAYGPGRLVSSATARCVETLLPFARRTGSEIVIDRAFTIGVTDAGRACARLLDLAVATEGAAAPEPLVVCTHGEIVSELVTFLCRELGGTEPDDPALGKGAFWTVHVSAPSDGTAPALAALERHAC
ncbi:histidine phosphatase family protein [Actinomadura keratinilytica]|uniref:histidine phosphatase family protein n=1 Tax=Actinomadura keratinilytica TaxID=547461 RepID=UPI00360C94C9